MTEAEWLACADPEPMLIFLRGKASDRKLRLFAVECCRRVWHLLTDERSRRALEVAEAHADGIATDGLMSAAADLAWDALTTEWDDLLPTAVWVVTRSHTHANAAAWSMAWAAAGACAWNSLSGVEQGRVWENFYEAFWIASSGDGGVDLTRYTAWNGGPREAPSMVTDVAMLRELAAQCSLMRDLIGPLPFRPVTVRPHVLAWDDRLVPRLAQGIYDERQWGDMPVLHDALLDAGCDDDQVMAHCRAGGDHVRGCWAVDLVLGKS
jgi:hypothetical protein